MSIGPGNVAVVLHGGRQRAVFSERVAQMRGGRNRAVQHIGHAVGGVCPFGINEGIPVYLDESLKRFTTVFPAVGSASRAIELNLDELYEYSKALEWIDVCKLPE